MNAREVKAVKRIELDGVTIEEGEIITVSKCKKDHVLMHHTGWYEIENEYIGETVRIISEDSIEIGKIVIEDTNINRKFRTGCNGTSMAMTIGNTYDTSKELVIVVQSLGNHTQFNKLIDKKLKITIEYE